MKGAIYSTERCPECGGTFKHDENRGGLFCPNHPDRFAAKNFKVKFGRSIQKRFKTYDKAIRFLTGLRFKEDEGTFDVRDYKPDNPLLFGKLAERYLSLRQKELKPRNFKNVERTMLRASKVWGGRSVKTIQYRDIEDWLDDMDVGNKTKSNEVSVLSMFFKWVKKREGIAPPEMPEIKFKLGYRQFTDLKSQAVILEDIRKHDPVRMWLGVKWLATYVSIRPGALRQLRERDINVNGCIFIPPEVGKEGEPRLVPMTDEDIAICESLPTALPDMPFFRHEEGGKGKAGVMYGSHCLYRAWKRACKRLGIEGVDMYGGTKHTTVTAMAEYFTPEEIQKHGTMHTTSKAFNRYFQAEVRPSRTIYEKVNEVRGGGKVVKLEKTGS